MSRQREALARILPVLRRRHGGCGILLFGSVGRGEERPDSDLDVMVVHDGDGGFGWSPGCDLSTPDLNVDLAVFPVLALERVVGARWYAFWELAQAAVVEDPSGLAARAQAPLRERFDAHPDIARAWRDLVASARRAKRGERVDIPFGGREGLLAHAATVVARETRGR